MSSEEIKQHGLFPGIPTALPPTISLNVFLLLCLFDLCSPTELSTGLQEMVWDKQSKSLCFLRGLGKVLRDVHLVDPMPQLNTERLS